MQRELLLACHLAMSASQAGDDSASTIVGVVVMSSAALPRSVDRWASRPPAACSTYKSQTRGALIA
jgi:hypothetical protein